MKKYFIVLALCFSLFTVHSNIWASTIESDPSAPYGYLGFADSNGYTLGQSFQVDTPYAVNTLESITAWIAPDYDGAIFNFNIYNASDLTASLFNTQFTLNAAWDLQQVAITGISLSLNNLTDYIFAFTLVNPDLIYYMFASISGTFGFDAYAPGQEFFGSPSGGLYPSSIMGLPMDLQFQAELSHESVPEPTTILLLGLGILGISGIKKKAFRE